MRSIKLLLLVTGLAVSPAAAQTDSAQPGEAITHQAVIIKAFDNFEAMMFAPLKVEQRTPVAAVKAVCLSVQESLAQLVKYAEIRKTLPLPDSLEEAQQLNLYLGKRFHAVQAAMRQSGSKLQAASKILETNCPELSANEAVAQKAVQTALAQYTAEGWCRAMMEKPKADWSAQDNDYFTQFCMESKPN